MDDNLFDKLKALFGKADKIAPSRPIIHEEWSTEGVLVDLDKKDLDAIHKQMHLVYDKFKLWKLDIDKDDNFYFMDTDKASAFAFDCRPLAFDHTKSLLFICLIAEWVKEQKYVNHLKDVMTRNRGESIETIYKIYLKPSRKLQKGLKAEQLYGNVQIEYLLLNNKPQRISLKASKYSDQHFHHAIDFIELLEVLAR